MSRHRWQNHSWHLQALEKLLIKWERAKVWSLVCALVITRHLQGQWPAWLGSMVLEKLGASAAVGDCELLSHDSFSRGAISFLPRHPQWQLCHSEKPGHKVLCQSNIYIIFFFPEALVAKLFYQSISPTLKSYSRCCYTLFLFVFFLVCLAGFLFVLCFGLGLVLFLFSVVGMFSSLNLSFCFDSEG